MFPGPPACLVAAEPALRAHMASMLRTLAEYGFVQLFSEADWECSRIISHDGVGWVVPRGMLTAGILALAWVGACTAIIVPSNQSMRLVLCLSDSVAGSRPHLGSALRVALRDDAGTGSETHTWWRATPVAEQIVGEAVGAPGASVAERPTAPQLHAAELLLGSAVAGAPAAQATSQAAASHTVGDAREGVLLQRGGGTRLHASRPLECDESPAVVIAGPGEVLRL